MTAQQTIKTVSDCLHVVNKRVKQLDPHAFESEATRDFVYQAKEELYELKDRVLTKAIAEGIATVVGYHTATHCDKKNVFELVEFIGHTFHRPCCEAPPGVVPVDLGEWKSPRELTGKRRSLVSAVKILEEYIEAGGYWIDLAKDVKSICMI